MAATVGIGKNSLLMQIGAAVAAGEPVAGGLLPTLDKTGPLVFLVTEDSMAVLQGRTHFLARSLEEPGAGGDMARCMDCNLSFYCTLSQIPILLWQDKLGKYEMDRLQIMASA